MEFKTLKEASSAYAELESSSEALLNESVEQVKALEAASEESKAASIESVEKIEALDTENGELKAEVETLKASNKELEDNKLDVQEEAAKLAAASGIELKEIESGNGNGEGEDIISREEFDAKSQSERLAFFKAGGKLASK